MRWASCVGLATMSTNCCLCGRWVPAHDALRAVADPKGPLDEATCARICGADASCFRTTVKTTPLEGPRLLCFGNSNETWELPAPAGTKPFGQGEEECAPCVQKDRVVGSCALLAPPIADGAPYVLCFEHRTGQCVLDQPAGRRAPGIAPLAPSLARTEAELFARYAHAERVSVAAFRQLAADLDRLGAPRRLARWARRAAREEERHALAMRRLARARGATAAVAVRGAARPARSLLDLARSNAVEGCVREAFAALLCAHQAANAEGPDARRALGRVAADEIAHARLAHAIHRWAVRRLDPRGRSLVDHDLEEARSQIAQGGAIAAESVEVRVGLPRPASRDRLARALPAPWSRAGD